MRFVTLVLATLFLTACDMPESSQYRTGSKWVMVNGDTVVLGTWAFSEFSVANMSLYGFRQVYSRRDTSLLLITEITEEKP